jgi:hypothetical protein
LGKRPQEPRAHSTDREFTFRKTRHMAWNILTDRTDAKKLIDDKRLATETQAIKLLCINSKPK